MLAAVQILTFVCENLREIYCDVVNVLQNLSGKSTMWVVVHTVCLRLLFACCHFQPRPQSSLKALTHQTDLKELPSAKADCCVTSRLLCLGQNLNVSFWTVMMSNLYVVSVGGHAILLQ